MSVLIRNGRIVAATDDYTADIVIDGECIHTFGRDIPAADLFVLPL